MSGRIERADERWAHPEAVEEGMYSAVMADILSYAKLEADDAQKAVDKLEASLAQMLAASSGTEPFSGYEWETRHVDEGCPEEADAFGKQLLIGMPKDRRPKEKLPVLFCIPGGGLVAGGNASAAAMMGVSTVGYSGVRACIVACEYRVANVAPYPAAINDVHAAYQYLVKHADELGVDTNRIVIWGTSSGGHLGLCLCFRLKRYDWCGAPMPRGAVIQVPVMDDVSMFPSFGYYFDKADGTKGAWDSEMAQETYKVYLGDRYGDPTLPPDAVPDRATLADVQGGFPPVWIPTEAEFEPGRDSLYRLVGLLHQAGVFCDLHVWGGTSHQSFTVGQTEWGKRVNQVIGGAVRDAITYDFRRAWLSE